MLQTLLSRFGWFLLLLALQVFVFNNIHFGGYATPLPYLYFLLILPTQTPRWAFIVIGFLIGLLLDLFTNTPGMAAATLCALGLFTPLLYAAFAPKDKENEAHLPSSRSMEWGNFMRYVCFATLIYCTIYYCIDAFSLLRWQSLLINIIGSSATTISCIVAFEIIRNKANQR